MTLWIADAHPDFQAHLDVSKLAWEGYSALIIKATEGSSWRSRSLADQWARQARETGLIVGAYHWLTNADPAAQVDNFLGRIAGFGWPANMIIVLDVESSKNSNPTWDSIRGWVRHWNERTGNHPLMIYTGRGWWNAEGRRWNGAALTPYLWHAQYVMQPGSKTLSMAGYGSDVYSHVPRAWWNTNYGGWQNATMVQFTSRGTAAGMVANIDLSAFEGTIGDLRALAGNAIQVPHSEDEDDMLIYQLTPDAAAARGESQNAVWASNGVFRWHVPNPDELNAIWELGKAGAYTMFKGGEIQQLGAHIGHDVSCDARLGANSERILTSWAQGIKPAGIRYSEEGLPIELGNPFNAIGEALQALFDRPAADITDDQIMTMAEAIAAKMSTSVETVAATGQALMTRLNAALVGTASAINTAMQDQAPRSTPTPMQWVNVSPKSYPGPGNNVEAYKPEHEGRWPAED